MIAGGIAERKGLQTAGGPDRDRVLAQDALDRHDGLGEQRRVDRARLADRERPDRDSLRHLDDG